MRIKKVRGVACERSGQPAPSHYSSPAVAPIPCFTHKFSGKNSRPAKSVPHSRQRQKRAARERERWAGCCTRIAGRTQIRKLWEATSNYSEKVLQNAVFLSLTAFLQSEQEKERWARIAGRQTPKSEKAERHHGKALSSCFCCLPLDFAFFWM